jgi:two-component system chemotaxis response regulator CheY
MKTGSFAFCIAPGDSMEKSDYSDMSILVVDDHMIMRTMVSQNLRALGVKDVDIAASGEEAYSMICARRDAGENYDIVFLDWHLPGMSGLDVLQKCRADARLKNVAIVMLTAEREQKNILLCLESGATSYLVKPVPMDAMQKNMSRVMQWREKQGASPKPAPTKMPDAASPSVKLAAELKPVVAEGVGQIFSSMFNADITPSGPEFESDHAGDMICVGRLYQKDMDVTLRFAFDEGLLRPLLAQIYAPRYLQDKTVYADAACEIVNILCAQVKAFMNEKGHQLELSLPYMAGTGKAGDVPAGAILNVRFALNEDQHFLVDVAVDRNPDSARG